MRRSRKLPLFFSLCLVAVVLCLTAGVSAKATTTPMTVTSNYDWTEGLLRITCTQEDPNSTNFRLTAQDQWSAYASSVQTIWITSEDVQTISSTVFQNFTDVKCVVLDTPNLTSASFTYCKKMNKLYFVGDESVYGSFVNSIAPTSAKHIFLDSVDQLCKVTLGACEYGRFITDAAPYEKAGSAVRISVVPDDGCRCLNINGGTPAAGLSHTRIINSDVTFTAECIWYKQLQASGTCGLRNAEDFVHWFLYEDGELFITGIGDIITKSASSYPWYTEGYASSIRSVTIDAGITSVPDNICNKPKDYIALTTVTIGPDVTSIGTSAFYGCPALAFVQIGESVTSIGNSAFYGCPALAEAEFMGLKPTAMGTNIFPAVSANTFQIIYPSACKEDWGFPDTNWQIGKLTEGSDLYYIAHVKDMQVTFETTKDPNTGKEMICSTLLPGASEGLYYNEQCIPFTLNQATLTANVGTPTSTTVTDIGYLKSSAKIGDDICSPGTAVIPDKVKYNGQEYTVTTVFKDAFTGNRFVETVQFPSMVRDVEPGAFYGCSNFTEFKMKEASNSFNVQDGILFDSTMTGLYVVPGGKVVPTVYEVPSTVRSIYTGAFCGCQGIKEVEISTGVEIIYDDVFSGATGLERVSILHDVRILGNNVFANCSNLKSLYIYSGVEQLGTTPLVGCTSLEELTLPFLGTSPSSSSKLPALFNVSAAKLPASLTRVAVSRGTLAKNAFQSCISLQEIVLGRDVTALPDNCFDGCTNLTYLTLGPAAIEKDCWDSDDDILNGYDTLPGVVEIPNHIAKIGATVFRGCPFINQFVVDSDNQGYISDIWGALYEKNADAVGEQRFKTLLCYPPAADYQYYCVKGSTAEISTHAFYNCNRLVTINIPNSETRVQKNSVFPGPYESPNPSTFPMRICVHQGSAAMATLGETKVWNIDNYYPESVQIQRMSDRLAFESGRVPAVEEYENLYFIVKYPGVTILLDPIDYLGNTIKISGTDAGMQTAKMTYKKTDAEGDTLSASFNVYLFEKEEGKTIVERTVKSTAASYENKNAYTALYDFSGKMLLAADAQLIDNVKVDDSNVIHCAAYLPTDLLDGDAQRMKFFVLDGTTPKLDPIVDEWLAPPSKLTWGIVNVGGKTVSRTGEISWRSTSSPNEKSPQCDLLSIYEVSADKTETLIDQQKLHPETENGFINVENFLLGLPYSDDSDTHTYYFTVTALTGGRVDYLHGSDTVSTCSSALVRSANFIYKKPDKALEPCTDIELVTDDEDKPPMFIWFLPIDETAQQYGGYTVNLYYKRMLGDTKPGDPGWKNVWKSVGSTCLFFEVNGEKNMNSQGLPLNNTDLQKLFDQNDQRAGYYAITITGEPKDLNSYNRSAESDPCEAFYYDGK